MSSGDEDSFEDAWRDLRRKFVRHATSKHLKLALNDASLRRYDMAQPLDKVLDEIRRKNIIQNTIVRAGRRIRVILRITSRT